MDLDGILFRVSSAEERLNHVDNALHGLLVQITEDEGNLSQRVTSIEGEIHLLDNRVSKLEGEFETQRSRLWALILVVISELLVSGLHLLISSGRII